MEEEIPLNTTQKAGTTLETAEEQQGEKKKGKRFLRGATDGRHK